MKAKYGYMGKLLFVNLSEISVREEEFSEGTARASGISPLSAGKLKGISIDSEGLKKKYYEAMGFDPATGQIRPEVMDALGLQDILS